MSCSHILSRQRRHGGEPRLGHNRGWGGSGEPQRGEAAVVESLGGRHWIWSSMSMRMLNYVLVKYHHSPSIALAST